MSIHAGPNSFSYFNGSSSSRAAPSAQAIKVANPAATDGVYWINDNNNPKQIYCNMTTSDGGWMLYTSFSSDNPYTTSFPAWNGNRVLYPDFTTHGFTLNYATHYADGVNTVFSSYIRRPEFFGFFYSGSPFGQFTMTEWKGPSYVTELLVRHGGGAAGYDITSSSLVTNNVTRAGGTGSASETIDAIPFNPLGVTPLFRQIENGIAGLSWIFMR